MDRAALAAFLRSRREALHPEDVGLSPGERRRTPGLRRDAVAAVAAMSTDYYTRLEQQRGPQPSEQMLSALARALRLTTSERDYLFQVAGRDAPSPGSTMTHVSPGLLRVLDRLEDTPALILSNLGETLVQNRMAEPLVGDQSHHRGLPAASYRWFTDQNARLHYLETTAPGTAEHWWQASEPHTAGWAPDPEPATWCAHWKRRAGSSPTCGHARR